LDYLLRPGCPSRSDPDQLEPIGCRERRVLAGVGTPGRGKQCLASLKSAAIVASAARTQFLALYAVNPAASTAKGPAPNRLEDNSQPVGFCFLKNLI